MLLLLLLLLLDDVGDVSAAVAPAADVVDAENDAGLGAVGECHGEVVVLLGGAVVADAGLARDDHLAGSHLAVVVVIVVVRKRVAVAVMVGGHHLKVSKSWSHFRHCLKIILKDNQVLSRPYMSW